MPDDKSLIIELVDATVILAGLLDIMSEGRIPFSSVTPNSPIGEALTAHGEAFAKLYHSRLQSTTSDASRN